MKACGWWGEEQVWINPQTPRWTWRLMFPPTWPGDEWTARLRNTPAKILPRSPAMETRLAILLTTCEAAHGFDSSPRPWCVVPPNSHLARLAREP